jgi:fatty acid desaturase
MGRVGRTRVAAQVQVQTTVWRADSVRLTWAWSLVLYLVLAAALADWIPAEWMVVAVPFIYVRLSLALHETLHVHRANRLSAWLRLGVILETPLALGYREHRALHLRHHRFNGAQGDPEQLLIASPALQAFGHALLVPERAAWQWVREHGVDAPLARGVAVRALLFAAALLANPAVFLMYLTVLRLSIGCAGFVFHHLLHQRKGRIGTFSLPGGLWVLRVGQLLFGEESMRILAHHREHHLWPQCPTGALPTLPNHLELPPGRQSPVAHQAVAQAAPNSPRNPPCVA